LNDPKSFVHEQTTRMQQAAADLHFEIAAKIKAYVEQISQLGKGPFRHVAELADFQFLCFQRGPKSAVAQVFLITPGRIEQLMSLLNESFNPAEVMRVALMAAKPAPLTDDGSERIGIVAHHLFTAKSIHGVFLPLGRIDEKSIAKAYRDLQKQALPEAIEGEGVLKELQAL
jgi:hypothetical protein